MVSVWEQRIHRAEVLAAQYPFALEPLRFYLRLARFQQQLQDSLRGKVRFPPAASDEPFPLQRWSPLEDRELLLPQFADFLRLVQEIGPPELAEQATSLRTAPREAWETLLDAYWHGELDPTSDEDVGPVRFFPKAFLQPYAALLSACLRGDGEEVALWDRAAEGMGVCPLCGARPQVSVLRPEGYGALRSLVCSRCETEWQGKRVRCVACGEEEFERLQYHQAREWPHVRVSACETCRTYIKDVDLSKDGLAVPVVDEIATIPLDLYAVEQGYRKLELNLIGT
jgi:formate dehydrogenase accessory protein FdhE